MRSGSPTTPYTNQEKKYLMCEFVLSWVRRAYGLFILEMVGSVFVNRTNLDSMSALSIPRAFFVGSIIKAFSVYDQW
jgi:hypothetical protein